MFINPTDNKNRELWSLLAGLFLLLVSFVLLFAHFWYGGYVEFDSFTNATVGFHVAEGKALYREIWGSKPPGIYFLDALFIKLFGVSHSSIWIAQLVSGTFLITFFYLVLYRITQQFMLTWLGTFLFMILFYFSVVYEGGNLTEEYGAVWILAGWIGILSWYYNGYQGGLWLGGASMCMALWFKEPFLFSVIPAGVWMIIYSIRNRNAGTILRFVAGALIPVIAFLLYFINSGTLDDYIAYLHYTTTYSGFTGLSFPEKMLNILNGMQAYFGAQIPFWPYLILITIPGLILARGKQRVLLVVLTCTFLLELYSLALSGYTFQHYYFQIIPTFYLCIFLSISSILRFVRFPGNQWRLAVYSAVFVSGIVAAFYQLEGFRETDLQGRDMDMPVIEKLNAVRADHSTLFVEDPMLSHLYVQTRMVSTAFMPVTVFHFFVVEDKYAYQRKQHFAQSMIQEPPDYIVTSTTTGVLTEMTWLKSWFPENYSMMYEQQSDQDTIRLWLRNGLDPFR